MRGVITVNGEQLTILDSSFDLQKCAGVFAIALGKAAHSMAAALDETLGTRLTRGVVSAPAIDDDLSARWQQFMGGHPVPNSFSLAAGHAALALLKRAAELSASDKRALVIFLVSGGGSAMMESLHAANVSLADLQAANKLLVNCGATIAEINGVRRAWSRIKGGGLSRAAGRSLQVSLIVSDTNACDEASVASGPTLTATAAFDVQEILKRYDLAPQFPQTLLNSLMRAMRDNDFARDYTDTQRHYTLLDNDGTIKVAARIAGEHGFVVELARDLVEAPIAEGCAELVSRLLQMRERHGNNENKRGVCLISGGEFVCPVRGSGVGGRNSEAALRSVLEFDAQSQTGIAALQSFVALHAGTDGIDGNSPAAGAIGDDTTLARAYVQGMNAHDYLARSDAYTFFEKLGDAVVTGATETNVRDLRIMLAR